MSSTSTSSQMANRPCGPSLVVTACSGVIERTGRAYQLTHGQLLGIRRGLLSVRAAGYDWVVPAGHGIWIAPNVSCSLRTFGSFDGWNVSVEPLACIDLPQQSGVIACSPLLFEALKRAASWREGPQVAAQRHITQVILDELCGLPLDALSLPLPQHPQLLRMTQALASQPNDNRRLEQWAQDLGMSARTLARRFVAETGLTFSQWRQRARLLRALELLACGEPVRRIARDLGYENVSAFIAMFRRNFATTPGQYYD